MMIAELASRSWRGLLLHEIRLRMSFESVCVIYASPGHAEVDTSIAPCETTPVANFIHLRSGYVLLSGPYSRTYSA